MAEYRITGQDVVFKNISRLATIKRVCDPTVRSIAVSASGELTRATPKKTGTIARQWSTPYMEGYSSYRIENRATTADGKHSLIEILDKGRGIVRPVIAKRLYIPLTNKGASKKIGAKPSKSLVYGVDYVYAKQAKPTKPKNFINPINDKIKQRLEAEINKVLRV